LSAADKGGNARLAINQEVLLMGFLRGRGVTTACVMAAVATALIAPSAASAKKSKGGSPTQCTGSNVTGQGAAVEVNAQTLWTGNFNSPSDTNAAACSGTQGPTKGTPTVVYTKSSSGLGLESWGVLPGTASFAPTNAFIGTEEPPNPTQRGQIESNETASPAVPDTVLTFPVGQEAITPLVHLPAGCTATSTADPGRLVLNNTTLEKIFDGSITEWSQITDDGDKLSGEGCNASAEITRVVRPDSAGTTHILKKYLYLINSADFATSAGSENWNELSEGSGNTVWPTGSTPIITASSTGDSAQIKKVAETASSIGYGSLTDSRINTSFVPPSGGAGTATFWTPVQNTGTSTKKAKYADPATDGESASKAQANCSDTKYTNGVTKFPPASVSDTWDTVTTATKEKNFPICGILYILALSKYSAYAGTTPGEAQTVADYVKFTLASGVGGGQAFLVNQDYEPLPAKLLKEAVGDESLIKD
jgi:ABC-type phosphate transport system substrate-binding protein